VEGTTQGILVVDGSMAGIGKLKHPITFIFRMAMPMKFWEGKRLSN
jgi:hypothetical protein